MSHLPPLCASPTIKHQCQLTLELDETFGVRGRQTLSPVSQVFGKFMFHCLVCLSDKFGLSSDNFSHQHLQLVCKHVFGLLGLLTPIIEICNQGTDHLTGLKCEAQIIYQSLKRLFTLYLKPCMLQSVVLDQLDCLPLGQVMFHKINLDIL